MLEKSFGLFFFLKQPKNKRDEERYVYLRITVDGIPKEISLKRLWCTSRWDQTLGRAKGNKEDALKLNAYLDVFIGSVYAAKGKLITEGKSVTSAALKAVLNGSDEIKRKVLVAIDEHNERMATLVGTDYAEGTLERFKTMRAHISTFIKWKYKCDDLELSALNYEFAVELEFWLKSVRKCNHNTTVKYILNFKKVVHEAVRLGWLLRDPFMNFKTTPKEVKRNPLSAAQLTAISDLKIMFKRLDIVRDIFMFSCYTGLAYIDVKQLRRDQIIRKEDGELWLVTQRQKTDIDTRLPLLPHAQRIMEKYQHDDWCIEKGLVLPVLSNQKMNSYLKEIADLAGISQNLTFHIARHTFATTVTLANGVPIESVSKMLGHSSIQQTQHYAKCIDVKISQDMAKLRERLAI